MQDVKAAIDELERAVTVLGLKGAELDTAVNGENWDEPKFLPLFKAAEAMGAVLFFHPQPQHNFMMQRTTRYGLFNSLGVIVDDAIVGGDADLRRRPRRVPGSEGVHRPRRRPGVLRDGPPRSRLAGHARARVGVDPRPPSSYQRRLYYDTVVGSEKALRFLLDEVGRRSRGAGQRLALRAVASRRPSPGCRAREPDRGREGKDPLAKSRVAAGARMTPERFARGMTFADYVKFTGARPRTSAARGSTSADSPWSARAWTGASSWPMRYARGPAHRRAERPRSLELAAQPDGPAKILIISEDWSSDCRRDVPYLARLAEAGGLELRIFTRDADTMQRKGLPDPGTHPNADLVREYANEKNGQKFATVPVAVFFTRDFVELHRYIEYPAVYQKDRVLGALRAARAARPRSNRRRAAVVTSGRSSSRPSRDWRARGDRRDHQRPPRAPADVVALLALEARIEQVAQGVARQVEGEHRRP